MLVYCRHLACKTGHLALLRILTVVCIKTCLKRVAKKGHLIPQCMIGVSMLHFS